MDKNESLILKGVAILMMLFLHLFNQPANVELCHNIVIIGETPLALILSRATNPVSFFLILSGYGLYKTYQKGNYHTIGRIKKLYVPYWVTCAIYVPIGAYLVGIDIYPGSLTNILKNLTAWHTTWNGETWFLLPYVVVALLLSKWLFQIRLNPWLVLLAAFCINIVGQYIVSRYGTSYLYSHKLVHFPIICLNFLFPFIAGAYLAKFNVIENLTIKGAAAMAVLVLLVSIRCCFETGAFHNLYAIAFICVFAKTNRPLWLNRLLLELGRKSTVMWFCHTYFCYYLFHDFVYSLKYPVIIFFTLIILSYLTASFINKLQTICKL